MDTSSQVVLKFKSNIKMLIYGYWLLYADIAKKYVLVPTIVSILCAILIRSDDTLSKIMMYLFVIYWLFVLWEWVIAPLHTFRIWLKEPSFADGCDIVADENCFFAHNNQMETKYEWSSFTKWAESKSLFVLKIGKRMFTVIPKNAFSSEDDEQQFRQLLEKNITNT